MSADFQIPPDTILRQRRAADPGASAWVSANAGAGKTKVLTDRVIRLLLAGAAPGRILCLTFTRAAAAEMTNRVFAKLGSWVTLDDEALRAVLAELTGERVGRATLLKARRLFARAVETPGGLKIETIHAFCERILHLVPFEANVPARFAVLDDSQTGELLATARSAVLAQAALRVPSSEPLAHALEIMNLAVSGDDLTRTLDRAVADDRVPGDPDEAGRILGQLAVELGLQPGQDAAEVRRMMLEGGLARAEWPVLAAELRRTGKSTDGDRAADLDAAAAATRADLALAAYLRVFFTGENEPRKSIGTKGVDPGVRALLAAEQGRLEALAETLAAAETLERNAALFTLAGAVRAKRDALKAQLGALDFDDLIKKTLDLLHKSGGAEWVLYKLDRGVDHVLVDEAQDTNPDQWRILRRLTEEFTAGAGRPERGLRTLFAVGDPKQSIYSFQGADPRWFEESRRHWRSRSEAAALRFEDVRLDLSFRSAPAVLTAVDKTFAIDVHYRGLSFEDSAIGTVHRSARPGAPGHVEIWPTQVRQGGAEEPDAWSIPVDEPERTAPAVLVAGRVAEAIRTWTRTGDEAGRRWRPRDILILARKRGPAFFAVIRALKAAGVPVAGADRFDIGEHIAVNDLVAAGQAALLPGNDLVLAAALKSPLVGLDDDDLIRIAHERQAGESLADALARHAASGDAAAIRGTAALASWRERALREGPFGFYLGLLGPGGGRRLLVERLGHEAADPIDAFLCYAQTAEIGPDAPSLATFLARFEASDHTIKRDLDSSGDEVRVMTVHGAKGLEAPIVVLIDGCEVLGEDAKLLTLEVGPNREPIAVWSPSKGFDCAATARARDTARARGLEEHNRLLYVAMTRAKDRLVIAPFAGARGGEPPEAWCAMVRRALACEVGCTEAEGPHGPTLVWRDGLPAGVGAPPETASAAPAHELPSWLNEPVAPEPEPAPPLRPSGVLGAAERSGRVSRGAAPAAEARRHGILVHALIEHLADLEPPQRRAAAAAYASARAPRLDPAGREQAIAEAFHVLDAPGLAPLFGPDSRAEAPIVGTLRDPVSGAMLAVSGQVDRLAVTDEAVIVADFKTGGHEAGAPLPPAYLGQLALYRALLMDAYPGRAVRTLLVWTSGAAGGGPQIVEPEPSLLAGALGAALAEAGAA
jgi:ATP-dependent helicase/nuclease subunit A